MFYLFYNVYEMTEGEIVAGEVTAAQNAEDETENVKSETTSAQNVEGETSRG